MAASSSSGTERSTFTSVTRPLGPMTASRMDDALHARRLGDGRIDRRHAPWSSSAGRCSRPRAPARAAAAAAAAPPAGPRTMPPTMPPAMPPSTPPTFSMLNPDSSTMLSGATTGAASGVRRRPAAARPPPAWAAAAVVVVVAVAAVRPRTPSSSRASATHRLPSAGRSPQQRWSPRAPRWTRARYTTSATPLGSWDLRSHRTFDRLPPIPSSPCATRGCCLQRASIISTGSNDCQRSTAASVPDRAASAAFAEHTCNQQVAPCRPFPPAACGRRLAAVRAPGPGDDPGGPRRLITRRHDIQATTSGAKITATTLISLIRMFRLGPEVSLNGSPTVSPMTAALCGSEPLPP